MYSPKTILSDNNFHYKRHLTLNIGQYFQVHEEDTLISIQADGTKSVMCLGPSGNNQGGFKFMIIH